MAQKMCVGPACDRPGTRRSLCAAHYAQLKRGVALSPVRRKTTRAGCGYPGCGLIAESGSLCKPHQLQQHRDGRLKPLRVSRVGPVSEACEVVAGGGHAPDDLLCKCTECSRDYRKQLHIRSRYGLSWEEYTQLLEFQGGRCAICGCTEPGGKGVWHVDHDHGCCSDASESSCGRCVRGIVCNRCNTFGLGWYERLPEGLRSFDLLNGYLTDPPAARFRAAGQQRAG